MIYLFITILLLAIILPSIWVKITIKKYSKPIHSLPGTGGEFARHLVERFKIGDVVVEKGIEGQDHYSPFENIIRLSPSIFDGKSISAVSIAAHEVGHAIQYAHNESITKLRDRYTPIAMAVEKIAIGLVSICPLLVAIFKLPQLALISIAAGLIAMLISVLLQLIILPMEWGASFNKALPIIEEGQYLNHQQLPAARQILRAAAMTYVAGTLSSLLNVWRWLAILRR